MTCTELLYELHPCGRCGATGKITVDPNLPMPSAWKENPPKGPLTCHSCDGSEVILFCEHWWRHDAEADIRAGRGAWELDRWDGRVPRYTYGGKMGYLSRPEPRRLFAEEELLLALLDQVLADGVTLPTEPLVLWSWLETTSRQTFARLSEGWPQIDLDRLNRGFLQRAARLLQETPW